MKLPRVVGLWTSVALKLIPTTASSSTMTPPKRPMMMYEFLSRLERSDLLPSPESDWASAPAAARCSSPVAAAEEDAGTYVRLAEGTGPVYEGRTVAGALEADAVKSFW